jgi:hypothetical protein
VGENSDTMVNQADEPALAGLLVEMTRRLVSVAAADRERPAALSAARRLRRAQSMLCIATASAKDPPGNYPVSSPFT